MSNPYASYNDQVIAEFRAHGGRTSNWGDALVLVHHVGDRSGIERIAPLMSVRDDDDGWLIAASKAGADDNPAWYQTLKAHPDVLIETASGDVAVRATELRGADRDAAWQRFTEVSDEFQRYQEKTARVIPVVRLACRDDLPS